MARSEEGVNRPMPERHPGLDPGSMNTDRDIYAPSVFMDSGFAGMAA
jgi:hypothetical protein